MRVEAEGLELIVSNEKGDIAIIPKSYRSKVLKYLEEGNSKAIDDLVSGLPSMEDYAEDGSLVVNNPIDPPTKSTKNINKYNINPIYDKDSYTQLLSDYSTDKYVKFGQKRSDGSIVGCLGGCRENFSKAYSEIPDYLDELSKAGMYTKYGQGVITSNKTISEEAKGASTKGPDSWEAAHLLEEYGLGKKMVFTDVNDPERYEKVSKINYLDIPIGSILNYGDARGTYVDKDAKSYRGLNEPLPRHSAMVVGYAKGVDYNGKPTADILIDNLGRLTRYGNSTEAETTWDEYIRDSKIGLMGITSRTSTEDYTYNKLKPKEITPLKQVSDAIKTANEVKQFRKKVFDKSLGLDRTQEEIDADFAKQTMKKATKLLKNPLDSSIISE